MIRKSPSGVSGRFVLIASLLLGTGSPVLSIWPFPEKHFKGNALLGAGSLGLDPESRVVAFGDFNGDQLYVTYCSKMIGFIFINYCV
jgi:hypothetical protein